MEESSATEEKCYKHSSKKLKIKNLLGKKRFFLSKDFNKNHTSRLTVAFFTVKLMTFVHFTTKEARYDEKACSD